MKNISQVEDRYVVPGLKVYNKGNCLHGEVAMTGPHSRHGMLVVVFKYDNGTISAEVKGACEHIDVVER